MDSNSSSTPTQSLTLPSILASSTALASSQSALASASAVASGFNPSPGYFKIIGIVLALVSGLFIGSSFVFKKKGLLISQQKVVEKGGEAGESHAYLKSPMWWLGMSLMIVGEICNFVAYAFADAVLVTPMGALSVVISAVLSSIFLKEKLTFFGKVGCFLCVLGATIIAVNGPQDQAVSTIPEFEKLFLAPGFLVYASIIIVATLGLIFVAAPRWGKTNMLVYIGICSIIGGLSVVSTQGLGASIITTIRGESQLKYWFMYFLIGFVVCTLLTEINYLNKALELFNTAMVTPTYYVIFTFFTLVTSVILFQGLKAPATEIITLVLGFLVICCGITLLQMSKVDPIELTGLDSKSAVFLAADKEVDNESGLGAEEPGVDGLRAFGGVVGSIHRNSLVTRQSTASSMAALSARNSLRQRRQESYLRTIQQRNAEIGMVSLKPHSLWDRPVSDELDQPQPQNSQEIISDPDSLSHSPKRQSLNRGQSQDWNDPNTLGRSNSSLIRGQDRDQPVGSQSTNACNLGQSEAHSSKPHEASKASKIVATSRGNHRELIGLRKQTRLSAQPDDTNMGPSPMIASASPPVRARGSLVNSQNGSNIIGAPSLAPHSSNPVTTIAASIAAGSSSYEKPALKSKEKRASKKKQSVYDSTELQRLVRPCSPDRPYSLSSSVASSASCPYDSGEFDDTGAQIAECSMTGQIRIVGHHPQSPLNP